jgi:hypothetical protein
VRRRVVVLVLAVLLGVLAVSGAWWGWRALHRTSYQQAVSWLPESTLRATWTDWRQVRDQADGASLDSSASALTVEKFLSRAYDLDLTSTSAVADGTYAMGRRFGVSPVDADWEMYGQSREGAVDVLKFDDSVDLEGMERNLRSLGYTPPEDGAGSGGVWAGSIDLVANIDSTLTPVFQNVVVLPDQGVVLLSDSASYASEAASVVDGSASGLDEVDGVPALTDAAGEPTTAVLLASDFACEALGMADASADDQATADRLIADAGGVSPLAGVVLAQQSDRSMVVGMHFESSDQASDDLRPRTTLASGDAVGQGGTFGERFRVVEAVADGNEITLDLEPASDDQSLMSDLTEGPLVFAAC